MGTGTFTRNRAWYQTVIWDEYALRHAFLTLIPTFTFGFPLYWYGTFINRELEQNFAATMYMMDYENRRNRLTHCMIMEHFEMHVEKVKDLLDNIKQEGFEKTFDYELKNPFTEFVKEDKPELSEELLAEIDEFTGMTGTVDEMIETMNLAHWERQRLEQLIHRRKDPGAPYKYINRLKTAINDEVEHTQHDPWEGTAPSEMKGYRF